MAIQMRRGKLADYDKTKMTPGEWGISIDDDTNDQKAYIAFAPGVDKAVMFVEDAQEQIAEATTAAIEDATKEAEAWAHGNSFSRDEYASGDGSTTAFTLDNTPTTINGVYVNGAAVTAYTLSGKTVTFSSAPSSGSKNVRFSYTVDTSTDNSKYYKELAASSASSASTSASTATTKASQASASASQASTSASTAVEKADEALASANAAATSETNAAHYASMLNAEKLLGNFAHYEATTVASKAYKVGEYLTYDGYLYKVTTAIASGGTISPGTNCTQTNVGDEISNLKIWKQSQAIASTSGSSGTLCTITDSRITADHVLTKFVPANGAAIISGVTCNASAGQVAITGTSTAATTAEILLERPTVVL